MSYYQPGQQYNANNPPPSGHPNNRPLSYYPGDDTQGGSEQAWAESQPPNPRYPAAHQQYAVPQQPPPNPPYPASSTYPTSNSTLDNQQYRPLPSPPATQTYNPQSYAQTPPTPAYSTPSIGYPVRVASTAGPRPYNPAAYGTNNNPVLTSQGYASVGPAYPGQHTSPRTSYNPHLPQTSPATVQQSFPPSYPQYGSIYSSGYNGHYPGSTPLPSLPFPSSPPIPPPRGVPLDHSPNLHFNYQTPDSPSPQPTPSPDFRGHSRNPSVDTNAIHHASNGETSYFNAEGTSRTPTSPRHSQGLSRTSTTGAHPRARPLPVRPNEAETFETYYNGHRRGQSTSVDIGEQEALFRHLERAVNAHPLPEPQADASSHETQSFSISGTQATSPLYSLIQPDPIPDLHQQDDGRPRSSDIIYDGYSDDSDAVADAGLEAMRAAEEKEAHDAARRASDAETSQSYANGTSSNEPQSAVSGTQSLDDFGYPGVDLSMLGGGFVPPVMNYGDTEVSNLRTQGSGSSRASYRNGIDSQPIRTPSYSSGGFDRTYPGVPPAAGEEALTGGFRRLSFEENDEKGYIDDFGESAMGLSGTEVSSEVFYPDGDPTTNRPLPQPPEQYYARGYGQTSEESQPYAVPYPYPVAPGSYISPLAAPGLVGITGRSQSLTPQSSPPVSLGPNRANTDAAANIDRRRPAIRVSDTGIGQNLEGIPQTPQNLGVVDLPTLPMGRRFQPSKLTQRDFDLCETPWALSSVSAWIKNIASGESELKETPIVDALANLFTHKVTTMNIADAETLAGRVVRDMLDFDVLVKEEEWLKFGPGDITGVLIQLTGKGCYSRSLHEYESPGRCYAHHCQRTVKKISSQPLNDRQTADWVEHFKLTKEDLEGHTSKEIQRQNNLHEIVQGEEQYMDQLRLLAGLYRDGLLASVPPIIPPKRLKSFTSDVFGKLDAVQKANEQFLLPQLRYRQQEQGPWIVGVSDIFRDWIRKAKEAYIDYAANFPQATSLMQQEYQRNILFQAFVESARTNKLSNRLDYSTFLKAPITKLQRYSLLLDTVAKNMVGDSAEKTNLLIAISEIKAVTQECDSRVAEATTLTELTELANKLVLREDMKRVELNLEHWGRQLIHRGDLQRMGNTRFTWLETHAILFDHYLVLAKTQVMRDATGGPKYERYDVSKMPIPMELLILETTDEDPMVRKGIGSVSQLGSSTRPTTVDARLTRTQSSQPTGPGTLTHTSTSASLTTINSNASGKVSSPGPMPDLARDKDDKIMYPFKIKHLGTTTYTLFASTANARKEWCDKIIEAKTRHAASLYAQNAEPFRLKVMADAAFANETYTVGQKTPMIQKSPLSRAIDENERAYAHTGRPGPICRARVNCATTFRQPYGKHMVAIGTDFAVYIAEVGDARGWQRVMSIQVQKVTQIAVLEEFNLFLLIADKSLIAYHLDVVCPLPGASLQNDSMRKAPQKLSGAKDVGFFVTGRMKDRTLVFYKKREGINSTFKILEPILHKSTTSRPSRSILHLHRGHTDFFRDYDEFYIPTDCLALTLFATSLAVSTSKGFEVLNLDKKQTWSVPDLKASHVATIATRLSDMGTLAMFRMGETEFLCVYEECAVYVNKHGDVSRGVVMEFVGRAKAAALEAGFLVLFDNDFVEIRDAANGRLKQVIAGRDVRCLDDGRGGNGGPRTVKFALQHPEQERSQLVVELILNNQSEKR